MTEIWAPVVGADGYEVSTNGQVRSIDRIVDYIDGRKRPFKGMVLRPITMDGGYLAVTIKGRRVSVHHLVLEAFVGPRPAGMECCHYDGDPQNNNVSNLRWDTSAANKSDILRLGRHNKARHKNCPRGHPLVAPNLKKRPAARTCRACMQARNRYPDLPLDGPEFKRLADAAYSVLVPAHTVAVAS